MALGGGTWLFQNKKLPGTYINFVSKVRASVSIADRGYGTMPLNLDWGPEDSVFTVTAEDFQKNSMKIFGYDYASDEIKGLRDLFLHLKVGYFYRLNSSPVKATCTIAKAKYGGTRGNDITVAVSANVDDTSKFDVTTYLDVDGVTTTVDKQKAKTSWDEVEDNDYVDFVRDKDLALTAGTKLTGGTNGETITSAQYQKYLDKIEPYYFNAMGYPGTDDKIQSLLIQATRRLRDDVGSKFQLVLYGATKVDYEGVISILNKVKDSGVSPASLVYWVTGAEASCQINATTTNMAYDGEYDVDTDYTQSELEKAITDGMFMMHNVTDAVNGNVTGDTRVLEDLNTFTSFTKNKNEDFSLNQVIRVLDQDATDISHLFNTQYLGKVQNDDAGRTALWGDIVALHKEYQRVEAIQNFKSDDVPIPTQGEQKTAVLEDYAIQPTCAMEKLYLKVVVA